MKSLLHAFLDSDKKVFFLFLCIITLFMLYLKQEFIESEIAAFEILEERGEMGIFHIFSALQYIGIPLVYLVKFTIFAFILWVGSFMFGYKITYAQLWGIVAVCESIFLVPELMKIGYFFFFVGDPDYFDLRAFYPFSMLQLFDYSSLPTMWIYPLKTLNIFELIYWLMLIESIYYVSGKKLSIARYIVLSSYVVFFFLWLGFYLLIYK